MKIKIKWNGSEISIEAENIAYMIRLIDLLEDSMKIRFGLKK